MSEGHEVTVFEADPDGLPASSGNAALIAVSEITPLANLANLSSVPRWLLDPLGPLALRWTDLPALTPWLLGFVRAALPAQEAAGRKALAYLMKTAVADHLRLGAMAGIDGHLRLTGFLSLHDTQKGLRAGHKEGLLVKATLGHDCERLSSADVRKRVPQLEGNFAGAIFTPEYLMVTNPLDVLRRYQSHVRSRGRLVSASAAAVLQTSDAVLIRTADGNHHPFDRIVVSAGIWSRDFARSLGVKVLLEAERGYNTTYTDLPWNLSTPVGFADHGFIASPLADGFRVGGAVELAKPDTPPNYARAREMRAKLRRYIPGLPEGGVEWMGRRPSTPDSLPVISRHPHDKRIVFAFGHGHLGLTQSAVTARHVATLIAESQPMPELNPFDVRRFN